MKMTFALDKILKDRNIPMLQLQKQLGISYPALNNLCKLKVSKISFESLEKICNILSCTPNDLFEFEFENKEEEESFFPSPTEEDPLLLKSFKNLLDSDYFQMLLVQRIQAVLEKKDDTK